MKQRQHVRRVRTKYGKKRVTVNRGVPPHLKRVKFYKNKKFIATGFDVKGRLQYVYPKKVKDKNSKDKYNRINRFAKNSKTIMGKVIQDSKGGDVEAQAVYTMYKTGFRPGSDKDTLADVDAFGVTTLLKKHVKVKPNNVVKFNFVGKKGVKVDREFKDKLLADIMKERKSDEKVFSTSVGDVRDYFSEKTGDKYLLKDLRTLKAFEVADETLANTKSDDVKEIKKEVVKAVSEELGNTPGVAAQAYIAPKLEELK